MDKEKPMKKDEKDAQIEQLEAQLGDYTDHLKRLQAEFENYMKRVEKERAQLISSASERLLVKLLLIIDDFERALPTLKNAPEEVRNGVQMIFKNLHKILDEEQVKEIETKGKLDPNVHEVVMKVNADQPEDTIIEEFQKGYTLNGKVIRFAKVKVSGGKKQ